MLAIWSQNHSDIKLPFFIFSKAFWYLSIWNFGYLISNLKYETGNILN